MSRRRKKKPVNLGDRTHDIDSDFVLSDHDISLEELDGPEVEDKNLFTDLNTDITNLRARNRSLILALKVLAAYATVMTGGIICLLILYLLK